MSNDSTLRGLNQVQLTARAIEFFELNNALLEEYLEEYLADIKNLSVVQTPSIKAVAVGVPALSASSNVSDLTPSFLSGSWLPWNRFYSTKPSAQQVDELLE